ncbi:MULTISPECIES: ferritin [unclassified Staphylococcus]|uniref:ferritin n=1 Tax=unclassified Staphylococcus TaxID=91994 RepID=UPI00194E427C|nr:MULTISPECIES: ferritin [unclassified Staphylococcus]
MLNKELLDALNEQMNHEYFAAHAYMAMAAYCDSKSYEGFANFYIQQAKEERFHGKKIYDYINDRGEQAIFNSIPAPKSEFTSILETFEDGLAQEQDVTRRFYNLSDLVNKDKDYATISFLNWFLDEQVEEESMFDTHIDYLKRIGDDSNTLYLYEKELASRSFNEDEA